MTTDEFFRTLTEEEWDEAEALADIAHAICHDLTKEAELKFVRAGIEKERSNPAALCIETLNAGLLAIGKPPIELAKRKRERAPNRGRARVRGV